MLRNISYTAWSLNLSKLVYGLNTILIKILAGVFAEIDKPILKFTWKWKGSRTGKIIFMPKRPILGGKLYFSTII